MKNSEKAGHTTENGKAAFDGMPHLVRRADNGTALREGLVQVKEYLVTGADGPIGTAIVGLLAEQRKRIRVLLPEGVKIALPAAAEHMTGDMRDREALKRFFEGTADNRVVIHAARRWSDARRYDPTVYDDNATGTRHLTDLCERFQVERLVYIGSLRALDGTGTPAPSAAGGIFAESMAEGALAVLESVGRGLDATLIYMGDLIGPFDREASPLTRTVVDYCSGRLTAGIRGEYAVVDVESAARAVLACCEKGQTGSGYILAGYPTSVANFFDCLRDITGKKESLPVWSARKANFRTWMAKATKQPWPHLACPPLPDHSRLSSDRAETELGYTAKPLRQLLEETIRWLKETKTI